MDELVNAGKLEEAKKVQYAANDIIYKMCSCRGNMYGVIKEMLRINENLTLKVASQFSWKRADRLPHREAARAW